MRPGRAWRPLRAGAESFLTIPAGGNALARGGDRPRATEQSPLPPDGEFAKDRRRAAAHGVWRAASLVQRVVLCRLSAGRSQFPQRWLECRRLRSTAAAVLSQRQLG